MPPPELTLRFTRQQASLDGKFLRVGGLALRMDPFICSGLNRFAPSSSGPGITERYVCGAQLQGDEWVVMTLALEVQLAQPPAPGFPRHPALAGTRAPQLVASKGTRQLGLIKAAAGPAPAAQASAPSRPEPPDDLSDLPF